MVEPTPSDVIGVVAAMSTARLLGDGMPRITGEYVLWYSDVFADAVRAMLGSPPATERVMMLRTDFTITPRVIEHHGAADVWFIQEVR